MGKKLVDGKEIEVFTWQRTASLTPEQILSAFRNSYDPRIGVTVDMIATGTDIKPLEIVFFMRSVASKNFFEQMKGRVVRVVLAAGPNARLERVHLVRGNPTRKFINLSKPCTRRDNPMSVARNHAIC